MGTDKVHLTAGRFEQASFAFRYTLSRLDALDKPDQEHPAARLARGMTLTYLINARYAEHHYEQTRRGPRRRGADHAADLPESLLMDFEQASMILSQLANQEPDNREIQLALAQCCSSILQYAWEVGDIALSTASKQKAVSLLRRLHAQSPETERMTYRLADTLAVTPEAGDKPFSDRDIADLTESSGLASSLHERFPTTIPYRILLASIRLKLGTHHSLARETQQAERSLVLAIRDWQALTKQSPGNVLIAVAYARTCWTLSHVLRRQNRLIDSTEQLESALT